MAYPGGGSVFLVDAEDLKPLDFDIINEGAPC